MAKGNAVIFKNKRDLIEWLERELPEECQYIFPGLVGYDAKAATERMRAPTLTTTLMFPTDALTDLSPAQDVSWMVGPGGRIRSLIPIIIAEAGTFTGADDIP